MHDIDRADWISIIFERPMKNHRVAVLYHFFPHYRAAVLRALKHSSKYEFHFFGSTEGLEGIEPFVGDKNAPIYPLKMTIFRRLVLLSGYGKKLAALNPEFVVVLGNPHIVNTWIIALCSRLSGRKVIFWAHGWLRKERGWRRRARNFYFGLADTILVYSDRARDIAIQSGFPAHKVIPIYNSLDWASTECEFSKLGAASIIEVRAELDCDPDATLFAATARLPATCRFDLMIEAASILNSQGIKSKLVFVGDGPERNNLVALASRLNVDVKFLGAIYEEAQLARILYAADASVHPGKVGLSAIHSLSYGTPVITHGNLDRQMPEVEAVVDGVTGRLFNQGSVEDLARAMAMAVVDFRTRNEIRDICRELVGRKYTPDAQLSNIERGLDTALSAPTNKIEFNSSANAMASVPSRALNIVYACNTFGQPDHDRCMALARSGNNVFALDWNLDNTEYRWEHTSKTNFGYLKLDVIHSSIASYVSNFGRLILKIRSLRPGILIVYGYHNPAFFAAALLCSMFGWRVITMNDSRFEDYSRPFGREFIKYAMLRPYAGALAGSRAASHYLQFLGVRNVEIYNCAIDTDRISELAQASYADAQFSERPFVVVARFVPKKNLERFLDAFEIYIHQSQRPRRLVIIGYGPLEEALRQQVSSSPSLAKMVEIRGYIPASDIPRILGCAFALVLPSLSDQFGIVATEALASGLPALVSTGCGAAELISPGRNGFTFDPLSVDQMADALMHVDCDEQIWKRMSENSRTSAKMADVTSFVASLTSLWNSSLRTRNSGLR